MLLDPLAQAAHERGHVVGLLEAACHWEPLDRGDLLARLGLEHCRLGHVRHDEQPHAPVGLLGVIHEDVAADQDLVAAVVAALLKGFSGGAVDRH